MYLFGGKKVNRQRVLTQSVQNAIKGTQFNLIL